MECREVLLVVWKGEIPIQFVLEADELSGVETPDPFFLLAPRITYLPLVTEKVSRHFHQHISKSGSDEIWFDHSGDPLKWHYPIGVLFDMYGDPDKLPWKITVHFKEFPADILIRCPNKEVVQNYFFQRLKEADFLKQHKTKVVSDLVKKDFKQVWTSFYQHKFEEFWLINQKLMKPIESDTFRLIPFKIYTPDQRVIQASFPSMLTESTAATLGDLIEKFYPNTKSVTGDCQILIHGVEVEKHLSLQWIATNLSYPDNFVHICIIDPYSKLSVSLFPM
eukprot:TRINITY_DN1826_c0_g1_i1.p1 TRINITY_DN1826_c0_g1~~TRINITY_DN1826_c0_g1_i1.p1  ORF type:complete len:279 (+),score=67.80 TRINITY_DN1826_c0_g1_i1:98-934(+)